MKNKIKLFQRIFSIRQSKNVKKYQPVNNLFFKKIHFVDTNFLLDEGSVIRIFTNVLKKFFY